MKESRNMQRFWESDREEFDTRHSTTQHYSILNGVSSQSIIGSCLFAVVGVLFHFSFIRVPPIKAVKYDLGDRILLDDDLAVNNRLTDGELLFNRQIYGAESLAVDEKTEILYTGFKTGMIAQISLSDPEEKILKSFMNGNNSCLGAYKSMDFCGRPLGMRIDNDGGLIVADAYYGLFILNWQDEEIENILSTGESPTNDKNAAAVRYLNDLDILPDGRIILSESSTKFDERDSILDLYEHRPNGRLLIFDRERKNLKVLKDGLYFPNGVQLSIEKGAKKDDPWRVLYSEMGMARVMQIWVPQNHKSTAPIMSAAFIEKLPGYPGKIRLANDGDLLIPISSHRSKTNRFLEEYPFFREFFTKLMSPRTLEWVSRYLSGVEGLVIRVSAETGDIIESHHDRTGRIVSISIAVDDGKGRMLLGSDVNFYIARSMI